MPDTQSLPLKKWSVSVEHRREDVRRMFLGAIAPSQRAKVEESLAAGRYTGVGLHAWLDSIISEETYLPSEIPPSLVQAYFDYPEALPLHNCENCGLHIPIVPSPLYGFEGETDHVLFPTCPSCGGRTGWYLPHMAAGQKSGH